MGLSSTELMIILVIVLVLFGGSRLPSLMEGMGKGLRSFKKAMRGDDEIDVSPREKSLDSKGKERVEIDAAEVESAAHKSSR
jgi:sec-independent protein translocase protein TatA